LLPLLPEIRLAPLLPPAPLPGTFACLPGHPCPVGIARKGPGIGQLGFGLVRPPMKPHREALAALGA
jgi:hypothetical protein